MKCRDCIRFCKDAVDDRIVTFGKLVYRFEYHISSGRMCNRIDLLESFGFWRRKFCIKNVEILSVGKIAESPKFSGEEDSSLQTS